MFNFKAKLQERASHNPEDQIVNAINKEHHAFGKLGTLVAAAHAEEDSRWGVVNDRDKDENSQSTRSIVKRYQEALGISHLTHPSINPNYINQLKLGYFEPIPTAWANKIVNNPLTGPASTNSGFDDAAEERLYWVLNNSIHRDDQGNIIQKVGRMKPDEALELRMAVEIDHSKYESEGDSFKLNQQYAAKGYSKQVPPLQISATSYQLFQEQLRRQEENGGKPQNDEIDVMVLLDVSSSMNQTHDDIYSQPRNIEVAHNILKRAIHSMETRDSYSTIGEPGVECVCFNANAASLGKVNWSNFESKWDLVTNFVNRGSETAVMSGWQLIKKLHFEKHGGKGKSWHDDKFGFQATPQMTKLSLLVLLEGETNDRDEFELELLSETWCYCTICLIGRENDPDHHRHANELTRIAQYNPRVQFVDVHGRICERMVVSDILQRVYASTAPTYDEIMDPRYDLRPSSVDHKATSST